MKLEIVDCQRCTGCGAVIDSLDAAGLCEDCAQQFAEWEGTELAEWKIQRPKGDWMQTYTGRRFFPLDPRPDQICIEDIAHALSLLCRYTGHVREFYSVAEHSWRVAQLLAPLEAAHPGVQFAGLMHDAAEAYISDLNGPFKRGLEEYLVAEKCVERVIAEVFGLPTSKTMHQLVKVADWTLLATERRDLFLDQRMLWGFVKAVGATPLDEKIVPWSPQTAERRFLRVFNDLRGEQ